MGFTISGASASASYDLYFVNSILAQRWQWRRVLSGIQCDDAGEAMFQLQHPDPYQGYFIILSAEDSDDDGLTDGYEAWFTYNGQTTTVDNPLTDSDLMKDSWEVEYGLDPTVGTGTEGGSVDRDSDGASNQTEHNNYYAAASGYDATFDPLIATPTQRPVVTISPADPPVIGFTIKRNVAVGGSKPNLTVYYAVGGSAEYNTDYTLTPGPAGLPRIYSVVIPLNADSVTVAIAPTTAGLLKGHLSVVVAVTPYAVSPATQVSDPLAWAYAVDWNHNRVTNQFAGKVPGEGFMINLNKDAGSGYLTIKPTVDTSPLPFINLANSGRGTVARIEVPNQWNPALASSRVAGEYYTTPNGGQTFGPGNPSRTTVDRYGNVWVGNRDIGDDAGGSITKIGVVIGGTRGKKIGGIFVPDPQPLPPGQPPGEWLQPPFVYNTCMDRDRDGLIHTSNGLDNKLAWNDPALPAGDGDEAVIHYVRTTPINVRSVAVDGDNNVWAGSSYNGWQELIDDVTGAPVTGQKFSFGRGGYGGVFDPYGVLWSAGYNTAIDSGDGLLRLLPGPVANALTGTAGGIMPGTALAYGIGIDPTTADVWLGDYGDGGLWQFKQSACSMKLKFAPTGNPDGNEVKGVVVDGTGNIWVAHAKLSPNPGHEVYRLRNTGEYRGAVVLNHPTLSGVVGKSPHGVCIDSQQRVWAICFEPAENGKYYAMRIDPTQGVDPNTGNIVGQVVEAVDLGQFPPFDGEYYHGPYNYSDMSGFVSLSTTQPAGVWDFVEDSGADYTHWSSVTLDSVLNSGNIIVEVRAADRMSDLPAWQFRRLNGTSGTIAFGSPAMKGRYIEVRVNLLRAFGAAQSPVLRKLSLAWGAPGTPLQITSHPKSQIVDRGSSAVFTVTAPGTGLSYQWFRNGVAVGTSSSLTVNNAQYINAGKYYVRVTDTAGGILNSSEARLHVNSTPGSTPFVVADNLFPVLSQTVNFDASMDVSPSLGPVYYQWRKNGVPIPSASGICDDSGNPIYSAAYSIASVQCADTGDYSVVFTNEYSKVASTGVPMTVMDGNSDPVPQVTVPLAVEITDINNPPTVTATACFAPVCAQWYQTDETGSPRYGYYKPIPGATGMSYTLPKPVPCEMINQPYGYLIVQVFDEGRIPHASKPVRLYGLCQP